MTRWANWDLQTNFKNAKGVDVQRANVCVAGIVALLLVTGCSGTAKKPEILTEKQKAYAALSVDELKGKAESIQEDARTLKLNFFAPRKDREVQKTLERLRAALKRSDRKMAMQETIRAEQLLSEGEQSRIFAQTEFRDELAVHTSLGKLQAMTIFPKEYQSLDSELSGLVARIEDGKPEKISKDKLKLRAALLALEVKTIRFHALNQSEKSLTDAKDRGVEKLAPLTYGEAVTAFRAAEAYIAQNAYDEAGISAKAAAAKFAIQHALHVADTVRERLDKKLTAEQLVRDEEQNLLSIGQVLALADARDRMLPEQVEVLLIATRQCAANSATLDETNKALDAANRELREARSETSTRKASFSAAETELAKLQLEADAAGALRSRIDELQKNSVALTRENERLRAESTSVAKLRARIDEMTAYCGPPPATE